MIIENKYNSSFESSDNRGFLLTEKSNIKSKGMDRLSTDSLVKLFVEEDKEPQKAIENASSYISRAVEEITSRMLLGGRLFYLGAGTSGRLGVLDAAECPPTFCTEYELVQGIIAGGFASMYKSSEDKEDNCENGILDLKSRKFSPKDCLVGITAGGTTPYVIGGLEYANDIGALGIAISCVPAEHAKLTCNIDIRLLTGPELLTGSTRLKAGTATKMALNIISTCVMIRLGKTYDNYMVDLSAKNSKLIDRSLRILEEVAGIEREKAIELLSIAKGSVKLALLIYASGEDREKCSDLLCQCKSNLREAMDLNGYSF